MRLLTAEPLARHSTFRVGGRADVLQVESGEALEQLALAGQLPTDVGLVLGGGSNVLISDAGLSSTVLALRAALCEAPTITPDADGIVWLDGAADWQSVAHHSARAGWHGLESMVGIPGTVGGAIVQSIGAYGYELRDIVASVRAVDLTTSAVLDLTTADIGFGYRDSALKRQLPPRLVVTRAGLRLELGARHEPVYVELKEHLSRTVEADPDGYRPADVAEAVLQLRRRKSMVYDPHDSQTWGAGSFFKNPECDEVEFDSLCRRLRLPSDSIPHWLVGGRVRLSAGWLVERGGFARGLRDGNVALCESHALGVVNVTGRASADELVAFAGRIRRRVYEAFGVILKAEPVLVGIELPEVA